MSFTQWFDAQLAQPLPLMLALLAAVLLLVGIIFVLQWRSVSRIRSILERQQQQLEATEQAKAELQLDAQRQHLMTQESGQRGRQALQQQLDERLRALERQAIEDAGRLRTELLERFEQLRLSTREALTEGRVAQQRGLGEFRQSLEQRLGEAQERQQIGLREGMAAVSKLVSEALQGTREEVGKRVEALTKTTDDRLKEISGQVEKRLQQGFEKTTETFTRVLEHLTRIDEAQKKITELSSNVVSLQEVLTDKRSRGAFGEVQLSGLVSKLMPSGSYALQHTLSTGARVDCMLFLPEPTGNVPIDAKFPLESYKRMADPDLSEIERQAASKQFALDIRKHIKDISEKYLIPGETSDGAVMFLPAEPIFAEVHARFPELVDEAQRARVWLVSPTTLMAVLTTARAVLKDEATRKQVHIIQDHLRALSKDFGRFQDRMDKLATHIRQAHEDVDKVNISAKKISGRFERIDEVQLDPLQEESALPSPASTGTGDQD